jgi:hypothetical protein
MSRSLNAVGLHDLPCYDVLEKGVFDQSRHAVDVEFLYELPSTGVDRLGAQTQRHADLFGRATIGRHAKNRALAVRQERSLRSLREPLLASPLT